MNFQTRAKFFYAVPSLFPTWNYPSRLAVGINLDDFKARNAPHFNFKIKGIMYQISREKAMKLGRKYKTVGPLPNLLPKEEFEVVSVSEHKRKHRYTYDPIRNIYLQELIKPPEVLPVEEIPEVKQMGLF